MTQQQLQSAFFLPEQMKEISNNKPPQLINGFLPAEGVAVLAGAPGTGKSFTALSWAAAVAEGSDWFGRKVNQTRVAYVLGEGFSSFGSRVEAWETVNGRPMSEAVCFMDGIGFGVDLKDPQSVERLIQQLMTVWPGLIIFDTFSMLAHVSNENDNAEVAQVMANINAIVQATNSTALLIHHLTKSTGSVRGASAFVGNADTVIIAARDKRDKAVSGSFLLSTDAEDCGKQRDGKPVVMRGFKIDSPGVLTRKDSTKSRTVINPNNLESVKNVALEKVAVCNEEKEN